MKPYGIFSNPYYRYEGGPISRLITFLANLMKCIEQLLLRLMMPAAVPQHIPPPRTLQPAVHGTSEIDKEKVERTREERELGRTIHRS
jgi:hypothetical protein